MEIWFWAALAAALITGVSNFAFKIAASRGYSSELFSFYGGIISIAFVAVGFIFYPAELFAYGYVPCLVFIGGAIAGCTNILKVVALQNIDSTIYFPLYKLVAPALAIVAGILIFNESFAREEWIGMLFGLFVPLMLITRSENSRQRNLTLGLVLVLITAAFSATSAVANKYATDLSVPLLVILMYASVGVAAGTSLVIVYKKGIRKIFYTIKEDTSAGLLWVSTMRAVLITIGLALMVYAFETGGPLAIVQTIHSMYILIPIVLAIIFYNEHWNLQKVVAIVLSVAALALLG